MNNRPKLTAMMESARRVAASVPAWMLDTKKNEGQGKQPSDASMNKPDRDSKTHVK
jgi:hypothetical protein